MEKHQSVPAEPEEEAAEEADVTVGYNSPCTNTPNTPPPVRCTFVCARKAWPPVMPGCGTAHISTVLC